MPRHERRLIERPTGYLGNHIATGERLDHEIVHNYRILRNWTQEIAAAHHGVSVRSWQRYEATPGAPPKWLMQEIARYARRVGVAERDHLVS